MSHEIELDDELVERMEAHLDEGETIQEFITELMNIYESEGRFLQDED